ncbi:MAG: GNAT family N-acetyltransferase [Rickettsiales bacterium]|nr:GNAT family N-acetyltransferase [Rickettsiales bacterium]
MLRIATPEDTALIVTLGRRCFEETFAHLYNPEDLTLFLDQDYHPQRIHDWLSDSQTHWRIAIRDDMPVGYIKWGECKLPLPPLATPQAEIHRLYVRRDYQSAGIGRELMNEAIAHVLAAGAAEICLGVWENNHKAIKFYHSYGFAKAGEYDFPVGRQIDREWIMRRSLL